MTDETIRCSECSQEFAWTEGEQEFYREKKLVKPIFCMICRAKKRTEYKAKGQVDQ